jgi:hypothetical protein
MLKLWEICEVAKIAIKRDAHNIDGMLISEELKVRMFNRFIFQSYAMHFLCAPVKVKLA